MRRSDICGRGSLVVRRSEGAAASLPRSVRARGWRGGRRGGLRLCIARRERPGWQSRGRSRWLGAPGGYGPR
eukprot:3827828-Pyramimonas_sp.AAC.1